VQSQINPLHRCISYSLNALLCVIVLLEVKSRTFSKSAYATCRSGLYELNYITVIMMNLIKYTDVLKTVPAPLTEKVD
jgi:hypothetical protein